MISTGLPWISVIVMSVIVCVVLLMIAVRIWPLDYNAFEIDTYATSGTNKPNFYISSDEEGQFDVPIDQLITAVKQVLDQSPRTKLISKGDDGIGFTYLTRSRLMGYPDFTSVSFRTISDTKSEVKIYSRARFGYSDMGANKGRVLGWLADIRAQLGT